MAVRRKRRKVVRARRITRAKWRPYTMSVEISTDFFDLKPSLRERLCRMICCGEPDNPPRKLMGGYCVIKRWVVGDKMCEQRICYDATGKIIFEGPILCMTY